ncbi:MAG: hypothetical protein QME77_13940, partial [bacterium]|nr:hypothetical protein [bacterium]
SRCSRCADPGVHDGPLRALDRSNRYRGFFSGDAVVSMRGVYLGRYRGGFFRDKAGNAVTFTKGASGGPLTPVTEIPPIPAIPPIPPINPIPPIPPIAPINSLGWGEEWDDFLID